MGDDFVVKIAAWTLGEGEGAGRIAAGKGAAESSGVGRVPVGLVEIFAVLVVKELPHNIMPLSICSRKESVSVRMNLPSTRRSCDIFERDVDLACEIAKEDQS